MDIMQVIRQQPYPNTTWRNQCHIMLSCCDVASDETASVVVVIFVSLEVLMLGSGIFGGLLSMFIRGQNQYRSFFGQTDKFLDICILCMWGCHCLRYNISHIR